MTSNLPITVRKVWDIADSQTEHTDDVNFISSELGIKPITAALLYNRGFRTSEEAQKFLRKETEYFYDSFLMCDMDKAVARIIKAIDDKEKIIIYGDYDVDGVTSVSVMYLFLKDKGADVDYYIPSRTGEGYGVNKNAVETLHSDGASLIITVDTGITAVSEVTFAKEMGIDFIITDHHECHGELPLAEAVVNPRRPDCDYPFKELAGVGVVFKVICALEQTYDKIAGMKDNFIRNIIMKYSDLVAIGTVADVMPLIDENRLIVSCGMSIMEKNPRMGLAALLEMSGNASDGKKRQPKKRKITSSLIGYVIAPRINAAGRITNASKAVEMFLSDSSMKVRQIADELCETNRQRQAEENTIIEEAYRKIDEEHDFSRDLVIVLACDGWHQGVIGIVSSRITEHYNLPSILISFDGDVGKGSGRSIKGLNLVDALKSCDSCLLQYGGHELAAGLSIERDKLDEFKLKINDYARENLKKDSLTTSVRVDLTLIPREINMENASELNLLEPYGIANPVPTFVLRDAVLCEIIAIGSGRHTRMILERDGMSFTAVYFGAVAENLDYIAGDFVDVVFTLEINEFQNVQSVQLNVRDMNHSRAYLETAETERELYDRAERGDEISSETAERFIPVRDDFVTVYLFLKNELHSSGSFTVRKVEHRLGFMNGDGYAKIRFIIDIMNETGLISAVRSEDMTVERYTFKINAVTCKINLDDSKLYGRLKKYLLCEK